MGNTLLDESRKEDPVEIFEQWLEQNPDLVGREVLTHNKLFESNCFKYCERSIKLAVFFCRDDTQLSEHLQIFGRILALIRKYRCMHMLPMRLLSLREFDRKEVRYQQNLVVAVRQFAHATLEQRLEARPSPSEEQKLWLIYQMVFTVYTVHDHFNAYHGNLRASNFLLTNYHYLLLTDFASYKPTYILQDSEQGLSQFRLYYASSIEKCNLAPEKLSSRDRVKPYQLFSPHLFAPEPTTPSTSDLTASTSTSSPRKMRGNRFEEGSEAQKDLDAMKRMDIFSLGVSILEVLSDGDSPLSYESLVRSQKEGLDLTAMIQAAIKGMTNEEKLKELLSGMLKEDPLERSSILAVQVKLQGCVEQEIYVLLWCCLSAFGKTSFSSSDLRVHLLYSLLNFIENQVRLSGYRFSTKPPRCLSGFNSLKIFAEMLEKGLIFAPRVRQIGLINKLLLHCERTEPPQGVVEQEEELVCEDEDERRSFFIQSSKKIKIAKRLSFVLDPMPRKVLCPPAYSEVQHLKEHTHMPVRLTHLSLRRPRIEDLLQEYKENQTIREERLRRQRYYRSGQIIVKVVFSCIRGCKYVASKLLGIELLGMVARDCTDAVLLRVILPTYMALAQDSDVSVGRQAFLGFLGLFYHFADPFANEEDVHYCEVVLEFFIGIVKQSKLRPTLFAQFREVYGICEWLEVHSRRFRGAGRAGLHRLVEVVKVHYGSYSRQEVRTLLSGNVPEHLLPDMFEFYISLLNTDRLQGLRLSLTLAAAVSPLTHRHVLDVLDSCVEGALDESGMGLFYAIRYFTLRKSTSHFVVRKVAPHTVNPSKWIRDEAIGYVRMCLTEYPPTKNYFLFKDIFDPPFPLRPEDVDEELLLPQPLRETDLDLRERKIRHARPSLTTTLFSEYLRGAKASKIDKRREEQVELWTQAAKTGREVVSFENYVKRQLQVLYQNNFLYYVLNMSARFSVDREKDKEKQQEPGYPELAAAFRKLGRDLNSIDHEKKELFESFEGTINSSFQKLLTKKNRDGGETVADKVRLAQALLVVGEVLCKFQMLKVRPIPRLGSYTRSILLPEKLPRPKGVLLAEISQHTETVTCLEKVADQFILSGSSDGTLRVFDSRKLQMNMTLGSEAWVEMRGQGEERVRVSAICAFEQTYAAVVGSSKGQIRIYPLERLPSRNRQDETVRYNANGQLEKLATLNNQLQNECFCYVTAQGNLGVQDIRVKVRSMSCSIGRERGIPRALCSTARSSILVGTIDGYVVNFDLRYNVISSVLQLRSDREALPVTGIYPCPPQSDRREQMFALTYPSRHYEFCCFDILQTRAEFAPQKQYTSAGPEEIVVTPYLEDRTSDEQFKLCRNGLIWRKGYEELSDFSKSFSIYDYLSDPLTRKQAKIREIWLDNCKNRYNQIASLYGRRSLPFLEYLSSGILTSLNPAPTTPSIPRPPFALLSERKQQKDTYDIDRLLANRPTASHRLFSFAGEETKDFLTCCKALPTMVAVGCRNALIKIYV